METGSQPGPSAPRYRVRGQFRLALPCRILLCAERPACPVIQRLTVDAGNAIACAYDHGPFKDVAVFSIGTSEVEVAGFRMQGEFFWLRMAGRVLKKALAITRTLAGRKALQEEALCAPFAAS